MSIPSFETGTKNLKHVTDVVKDALKDKTHDIKETVKETVKDKTHDIKESVMGNIKNIKKLKKNVKLRPKSKLFEKTVQVLFHKTKLESVSDIEFASDKFNPQTYTNEIFAKHDWKKVDTEWKATLQGTREKVTDELQAMVFKNYEKFIDTSKDISTFMESDILELSNLVNEMKLCVKGVEQGDLSLPSEIFAPVAAQAPGQLILPRLCDTMNDFEVAVVKRKYEDAVTIYLQLSQEINDQQAENSKREIDAVFEKLKRDFARQSRELKDMLKKQLYHTSASNLSKIVTLVSKIESTEFARDTYLKGKSQRILQLIENIPCYGEVSEYIDFTADVVFCSILRTGKEFTSVFNHHTHMSAFTQWVLYELTILAAHFKIQVFISDEFETIAKCLHIMIKHCSKLEESGICVTFHLQQILLPEVEKSLNTHFTHISERVFRSVEEETWQLINVKADNEISEDESISVSSRTLSKQSHIFVNSCAFISNYYTYPCVIKCLLALFEGYFEKAVSMGLTNRYSDYQLQSILTNVRYVAESLIPKIISEVSKNFQRSVPELDQLRKKVQGLDDKMARKFGKLENRKK